MLQHICDGTVCLPPWQVHLTSDLTLQYLCSVQIIGVKISCQGIPVLTLKCFISFQHKPGLLHCSMTSLAQNEPQIEPLLFLPTLFSSLFSSICSSSSSTSLSTKTNANRHGARTAEHSHCSYSLCCAVKLLLSEGSASSAAI